MVTTTKIRLHGGRLNGAERATPIDADGLPAEFLEFEYDDNGIWYVEYRRDQQASDCWHFNATGIEERADED